LLLTARRSHGWRSIERLVPRLERSAVVNLNDKDERFVIFVIIFISCTGISSDGSLCLSLI